MKSRKSCCTTLGVGVGVGVSKMLTFYVQVFYVMGKALSGELSCPCDRFCYFLDVIIVNYLFQGEWVHFQGKQLCHFRFWPLSPMGVNSEWKDFDPRNEDQFLKERICSLRSKFFLLKVDPLLECVSSSRIANRKSHSLSPLEKIAAKQESVPIYLKPEFNDLRKSV